MRWSTDTAPPVVLHAKPSLGKKIKCLTWQLYHSSEYVIQKLPNEKGY